MPGTKPIPKLLPARAGLLYLASAYGFALNRRLAAFRRLVVPVQPIGGTLKTPLRTCFSITLSATIRRINMNNLKRKASRSPQGSKPPKQRQELDPEPISPSRTTCPTLSYPNTRSSPTSQPVPFQQPTGLLTFSYTPQRVLEFTDSALRYYVDPPPGADLRYGYDRWIKRTEERTRLDGLLRAVERVMSKADASLGPGSGGKWLKDISVVTWRGIMTK